ncbi:MAG: transglycosylase SLT domain-containing protein [Prevotellaceae bacterium]|nr:transglycosylase SLT domain-containing protein [Prevotellaceae bacterium]MDY3365574.1 transglycosylase SLT domain-containing protein [Prevotella sp.]
MKKVYIIISAIMLGSSAMMHAQTTKDKEITVTTAEGNNEVIELPEGMTYELDSLLHLYHTERYLRPDADCNFPNINPQFPREVFIDRLSRLPNRMEMPYNDVVQKFIDKYSNQLRRSVSYMLGAANFYMPIFEQALETYGLPLELKYLPVIESALNPNAVSRVGATGLWQFMLATGKQYGLEVNSLVDERRDIVKSSYAAAEYLSDLYKIFGDWNLVIAAYNAGPQSINKAIHRAKGEKDYWKIYPYLPKETRGYVPGFIAANYIMNYYCEHNICPMVTELPTKTDTVMVDRDVHFEQIAAVLNMDMEEIKMLNPQYRTNLVNGGSKPSSLRLPAQQINNFIDKEQTIYAHVINEQLLKRKEVEVEQQVVAENTAKYSSSRNNSKERKGKKGKKNRERNRSVTVKSGDTLYEIAARNNISVSKLKKLNKISGSNIRPGKKLKVK